MNTALGKWYLDIGFTEFPINRKINVAAHNRPVPYILDKKAQLEVQGAIAKTYKQYVGFWQLTKVSRLHGRLMFVCDFKQDISYFPNIATVSHTDRDF